MYAGRVYKAPSGQWSWAVSLDGVDIAGGAGYESEDEAQEELDYQLGLLSQE